MSFQSIIKLLDNISEASHRGALIGAADLIDETLVRVHSRGEATDGSKLSSYSEKPYFTSIDRFANRGGIPADLVSKNKKWVQLPEGYKSFRAFSGRQTKQKDLRYTGLLEKAYKIIPNPEGNGFKTGYIGSGQEPDPVSGVTPGQKMGFLEAQEKKSIINPNDEELQLVIDAVLVEIDKVL